MGSTTDSGDVLKPPVIKGIKFGFAATQTILCLHQNQLYVAKILQAELREGEPQYFVHYQGWNKKWDEWVHESRIMEHTDENLQKAKDMKNGGKNSKRKSTSSAGSQAQKRKSTKGLPADSDSQSSFKKDDDDEGAAKKEKIGDMTSFPKLSQGESSASPASEKAPDSASSTKKPEGSASKTASGAPQTGAAGATSGKSSHKSKPSSANTDDDDIDEEKLDVLGIELPAELAKILVDDWEFVEVRNMLVHVPAEKTVDIALKDYVEDRKSNFKQTDSKHLAKLGDWVTEWSFRENALGIKRNFNHIFGAQNLYRIERLQYSEILKNMESENKQEAKKHPVSGSKSEKRSSRGVSNDDFPNRISIEFDFTTKYGVIHLLRSFLQFDHVLVNELRPDIHETTLAFLQDFLEFLNDKRDVYFSTDNYFTPPLEYSRKALGN